MAIIGITSTGNRSGSNGDFPVREPEKILASTFASGDANPIVTPSSSRATKAKTVSEVSERLSPHVHESAQQIDPSEPAAHTAEDSWTNQPMLHAPKVTSDQSVVALTKTSSTKKYKLWDILTLLDEIENVSHIDHDLLTDNNVHPLTLLLAMSYWFGDRWLEWEPETLWSEIAEDCHTTDLPQLVKDKIMAVRAAHHINDYYENYQALEKICVAFNHQIPHFHYMQPVEIKELCNAINILNQIRDDDTFSNEIHAWIKCLAKLEGFAVLPPILQFAEEPDGLLYEQVLIRMKDLEEAPDQADHESVVDMQCMKILECYYYTIDQEEIFSDDINKYFLFK